tara:strand:- start:10725 stop:11042 length:318 start_codon:yes stop_codon:yes gene_type:complete
MIEKELSTGKRISIKELSLDKIAELDDIAYIEYEQDGGVVKPKAHRNVNKSNLQWLREGLGACSGWVANGVSRVPDEIIKSLSTDEKQEMVEMIKDAQTLDEKKV